MGCDGVARVLDFGIACGAGREQVTRHGQIKGKMAYMAPEILRGRDPNRRADVYGVAVVLWETLTGARLFVAENEALVLAKVLSGEIASPGRIVPSSRRAWKPLFSRGSTATRSSICECP